jgi:serine protease AprX
MLVALLALSFWATPANAQRSQKLDRALREAMQRDATSPQRVIITVKPGMRPLLRTALKKHGDQVLVEHPSIDALTAEVHGEDVAALANDPAVRSVSLDAKVTPTGKADRAPSSRALKYYSGLRTQLGLSGSTLSGADIGVAIIDSGIAPVADLASRIKAFVDFTKTNTPVPTGAYDDYGHGTHVAGLIGGSGFRSGFAYMGVAPAVHFVGLKVLDAQGEGRASNVIAALDWAVANADRFDIDVINLSLGHPIYESATTDPLVLAVERAVRSGLVVVVAAGNYGQNPGTGEVGYAGITSPGNAPSAITVGSARTFATIERTDDRIANFSSRGPTWYDAFAKPDMVAPGDGIVSDCTADQTLAKLIPKMKVPGHNRACFIPLSGTSISAAIASGAVAIVLQQVNDANPDGPGLTPNAVKAILQYTAIPVARSNGDLYDGLSQGTGGINLDGATAVAKLIDTSMPVNAQWLSSPLEPVSTLGGAEYAWAQNIVWGGNRVTSVDVLYTNSLAWGDNIVWGTAFDGDNIVWGTAFDGDNIVWGTASDWGDNIVWGTGLLTSADGDNIVWGTVSDGDNIVWGTIAGDNIVWGTIAGDNIVSGTSAGHNIVRGTRDDGDNIVWGTRSSGDNIVWGTRSEPKKKGKK